jgi:GNAT superfamily N-acetyltransferase
LEPIEYHKDGYLISTEKSRLNLDYIHRFLSETSYWASGRTKEVVLTSVQHSLCFGVYSGDEQVGFARVVSDYATFAWLCDVFIHPSQRGKGLGKWLVESVIAHPALQTVRRVLLATWDAHELYRRYGGFTPLKFPERWMERLQTTQPSANTPPTP